VNRAGIFIAVCLLLAGCSSSPSDDMERMADRLYPTPAYMVGDTFIFDNPYVRWQVTAIKDGKIHWASDGGDKQVTDQNPLLPVLLWDSPVHGKGRRLISAREGSLFPMEVGKKLRFRTTVSMDKPPYGWEFDWDCSVVDQVAVRGPAHREYQTFKVKCMRQNGDALTFFYAPKVGHYIVMENEMGGGKRMVRRMLAYQRTGRRLVGDVMNAMVPGRAPAPDQQLAKAPPTSIQPRQPPTRLAPNAPPSPEPAANPAAYQARGGQPAAAQTPASRVASGPPRPGFKPERTQVATAPQKPRAARITPVSSAADTRSAPAPVHIKASANTRYRPPPVSALQGGGGRAGNWPISVHLASYRSRVNAVRGWRQLVNRNQDVLGALKPDIQLVNTGARGTFYRLKAQPLPSHNAATELCRTLKSRGAYCQVSGR
jgi:hypothetical protein